MSIYMAPIESSLADISDYSLYANMQVGSNGNPDGDPTSDVGDIYGEENWATFAWDADLTGGFDTGTTAITFDAKTDGTETLTAADLPGLNYSGESMSDISSVVIEAAVQIPAEVKWSGIYVEFLKDGTDVEDISVGHGPDVNTIDTPSSTVADQTLTITPTNKDCDEVIVTGSMRMRSPGVSYPTSTAMYTNIFVMSS